ncbi:MAG: hypothetical protein EOP85_10315 [Verrucomicrobiaceae bacterium]|nr:MAG: hypothetical protein EOP85_10315 [Verrucomicrobiaceae bacterium]
MGKILAEPQAGPRTPPDAFLRVVDRLMCQEDAFNEPAARSGALEVLNIELRREGLEAFHDDDGKCHLRALNSLVPLTQLNPHRPFSPLENSRRNHLVTFLDQCSEDELIEVILLPLFRQLGFHRISSAGHKDKALEFGKDLWMRYVLPTQHVLYFGLQVKKGKLDSAGVTKGSNTNVAEIHNQALMMLGHEIFDPETSRRVLVDHAFIVAGGEITKAARSWIGQKLDVTKRSQIMFMDREDILNLFIVANLPLPEGAIPAPPSSDEIPF